jgi:hypothetical protein
VKSFVKSYPDIIRYVDEEIASADSGVAKRDVAFMRQLAREVRGDQPAMSIEEHLAAYGAVESWEAREPPGRGGAARSRNATYGQTSHRQRASCATTSTSDYGGRK